MSLILEKNLHFPVTCEICGKKEPEDDVFFRHEIGKPFNTGPTTKTLQIMCFCNEHNHDESYGFLISFLKEGVCGGFPHLASPNTLRIQRSNGAFEDGFSMSVIPDLSLGQKIYICYKKVGDLMVSLHPVDISNILKWNPEPQL